MRTLTDAAILLVDDERELLRLISQALREAGFRRVVTADSAARARAAFAEHAPDLVVLDINLPDGDGFTLLRTLRAQADVPALFLSARDADSDRLFGLGLGADDYLTKPFLMQELLLRIQRILHRAYRAQLAAPPQVLTLGARVVHLGDARVDAPGGSQMLTATELALLECLAANRGHIVTFDALCARVWGEGYYGYANSLNVHIRHLREKLEDDPSHPRWLLTARGLGYRLVREDAP